VVELWSNGREPRILVTRIEISRSPYEVTG
jgi:hypothetical protein